MDKKGFTLVELSIVMVIMALFISGLFYGRAMIRTSQLQAAVSDADSYKKAFLMFRDKYKSLPGDMPDAHTYWGSATGCPTPAYSTVPSQATCDGDGNGQISNSNNEVFTAWQHLTNAGMLPGSYVGMTAAATVLPVAGVNVPGSSLRNGVFMLYYLAPLDTVGGALYPSNYGHVVLLGAISATANYTYNNSPLISAAEAALVDQKIDDGKPGYGNVLTLTSAYAETPNCATSADPTTAVYNTSVTGPSCTLLFLTGF